MTLYWWTHWFWITAIQMLLLARQPASVHGWSRAALDPPESAPALLNTRPFHTPATEREPLGYPPAAVADVSDTEDVFNGRSLLETTFRKEWLLSAAVGGVAAAVSVGSDTDPERTAAEMPPSTTMPMAPASAKPAWPNQAGIELATTRRSAMREDIIATRLSTRKRPYVPDMSNVTRVNVTLIR